MLLGREKVRPVAAIERLAGMQAQLARPPYIGLWSRLEGFEREALSRVLRDKQVVRVTAMRTTLHLMSAKDYLKLRAALQPALSASLRSALGKEVEKLDLAKAVAHARAFFDEEPRTMEELRTQVGKKFGVDARVVAYAVRTHLPLVQVPTDAEWGFPGAAAFAAAETWLGGRVRVEPKAEDAQALVRSYLGALGPASVQDAQAWSGVRGLAPAFEAMRDELRVFSDERGRELFDLPKAPRPDEDTDAPVRLLPDYDNLLLGHDDRARVIDDAHRKLISTANLMVLATFLVDGRVAGRWKIERGALTLMPFVTLQKKDRAALEEEGLALLAFVEPDGKRHAVRFAPK
jgi:hypothetical protein